VHIAFFTKSWVKIHERRIDGFGPGGVPNNFWGLNPVDVNQVADPEVVYDRASGRFWACAFVRFNDATSHYLFAVSDDSDPSGPPNGGGSDPAAEGVWRKFVYPAPVWANHPLNLPCGNIDSTNMAVDSSNVYLNAVCNVLQSGSEYNQIVVFPKGTWMDNPGIPLPSPAVDFVPAPLPFKLTNYNFAQKYTYDTSPQYLLEACVGCSEFDPGCGGGTSSSLDLHAVTVVGSTVQRQTVTIPLVWNSQTWTYCQPVGVPHPNSSNLLFMFDSRIWATSVYNKNDADQASIWACHHITTPSNQDRVRVRWYQIDPRGWPASGLAPSILQIGEIAPPTSHTFMPSIAADEFGTAVLTYAEAPATAIAGTTPYIKMKRAIRKPFHPSGTTPDIATVKDSSAYWDPDPVSSSERWADYSGTDWDPVRPCHVYGHHEFYDAIPVNWWDTWIERYNVCQADFDDNGQIETADMLVYADKYSAGDVAADLDQDKMLTAVDYMIAVDLVTKGKQ
jgi:hypothetical protein